MKEREHDERLNDPSQLAVRNLIREIPEEELSMAWRSDLNQKILAMAAAKAKRTFWNLVWKPAAGLALAGALAGVLFLRPTSSPSASGSDEATALLAAHRQSAVQVNLGQTNAESGDDGLPTYDEWDHMSVTEQ